MPDPKSKITIEEINSQFYQLNRICEVSSEGYSYDLDIERHENDVNHARNCISLARSDFESGILTSEEYEEENKLYLYTISRYYLIDEDRKICGEYFSDSRIHKLFYWRIIVNGSIYYRDENNNVFTYSNRFVGRLYVGQNMELSILSEDNM